jgi:hypothetical protein
MPVSEDVAAQVHDLAARGYRPPTIAAALNRRGVPTPSGRGEWWAASVAAVLDGGAYRRTYMRAYRERERAGWGR